MEANLWRALREMIALVPGAEIHDDPEALWFITGVPHPLFNGILRPHLAPDDVEAWSAQVMQQFRARGVPLLWWLGPNALPGDLGTWLEQQGLRTDGPSPGMTADLLSEEVATPLPPCVEIVQITDSAMRALWGPTLFKGFGLDCALLQHPGMVAFLEHQPLDTVARWRHYLALCEGTPAGAASLFLAEGVAGIYNVAVLPELRRQGIGVALTARTMREARTQGYRVAVLQASALGAPVYRQLGFREICAVTTYVWLGERSDAPGSGAV
jgi:GNAT superfamily N-acetyltransferase